MLKNSVLILGDSTSMSIGIDGVSYPYLLSEAKIWEEGTKLINCSLPGFTSADLCAFFFNNINSFGDIQSVIIYPGNCDTMSSELERPKYSKYYIYKKKFKQIVSKNKPLKLKNKLLYFKWNNEFRQEIEAPTTVDNYTFNIEKIVNYCVDKSIQVILINPVAHKHFPSGVGSGNFSFYHYYDIDDRLSRLIEIEDKRFIDAYKYFELENYEKAAAHYKDILETPGVLSSNLEFQTLVVNNFAVCQAKLKKFDEAILLLNIIKKEINVRKEIVLYNLATISKSISKIDEYNRYIEQSYEFDTFMYRVRDPYRKVVSGIADKYKIPMLDIADISDDDSFIDHCHLLPN